MRFNKVAVLGLTSLLAMSLVSQARENQSDIAVAGFAYADQGDQWLYREDYIVLPDNRVEVVYSNQSGDVLARKVLDYKTGLTTPSFYFHDSRFSVTKSAQVTDALITLSLKTSEGEEKTVLQQESKQVIDAGFTHFVRQHWNELLNDQAVEFFFALPNRGENVELEVRKVTCEGETVDVLCFRFELANRFLAMFVDSIALEFDEEMRLTRYSGRSNLSSDAGKDQDVIITYQYFDQGQTL
ncbi:hypothetical protein QWI17_06955 [Gilvimarinus sp. SDUM040013]|uniref:DUF3108 domain-containing protein n=1 Tax=Gilvimarinus gilvus TaxID=3058038 RepID=A0ABU4S1Z3_9GAMM|nr:hypothetical protein [Gilvimarinus sp. SDUM040013]MDO3385573.1 hypothetical protein [Gilvimarinus sp. SDUM040013]MDX6851176.1 hypothetical protein [Gilvimarinus sp. SDUM040013]